MNGRFIAFEGIDGSGKTTCIHRLEKFLKDRGLKVRSVREPGDSPLGEKLRTMLLHGRSELFSGNKTELLLFYAARIEFVRRVKAWLERGIWVISDRFNDSSFAYQSYDNTVGESQIAQIDSICLAGFEPDLVFLLDIDPKIAAERVRGKESVKSAESSPDRFHQKDLAFFDHVTRVFRRRASELAHNHVVIDAAAEAEVVAGAVMAIVNKRFFSA